MSDSIVFVDVETTGLNPDKHDLIEIAWAINGGDVSSAIVPHKIMGASAEALEINRYNERKLGDPTKWSRLSALQELFDALPGATLAGANPRFDEAFIVKKWGHKGWHHRLLDVEAYAAGALGNPRPLGLNVTAELLGVGIEPDHTAAVDVEVARQVYLAAINLHNTDEEK